MSKVATNSAHAKMSFPGSAKQQMTFAFAGVFALLWMPFAAFGGATATLQVSVQLAVARTVVYVDFLYLGAENGSEAQPYNSLAEAVAAVAAGGTIHIDSGNTPETMRITKAMTLRALNGTVVLGRGAANIMLGQDDLPDYLDLGRILQYWQELPSQQVPRVSNDSVIGTAGTIFEPVLPRTRTAAGVYLAHPSDVLAIRLRSKELIQPESIVVPVQTRATASFFSEWAPVTAGDLRDLWILVTPQDEWLPEDEVRVSIEAETMSGEELPPLACVFQIQESIEPPNNTGLTVLYAEDVTAVQVPAAVTPPLLILPDQVFDPPQRVWLPVPRDAPVDSLRIYYYRANGAEEHWYPAENVEGWAVPGSLLRLDTPDGEYLGLLINHGGTVQVAPR